MAENRTKAELEAFLIQMDHETVMLFLPTVIFILILMVVGISGNVLVLIVYIKKFKSSTTRCFVLSLSVVDLLTCVVSMPGELFVVFHQHTFSSQGLCRLLKFNNVAASTFSGLLLVGMAIDRYRKICRPLERQLSTRAAMLVVFGAFPISMMLSVPYVVLAGLKRHPTSVPGVTAVECDHSEQYSKTKLPTVINAIFFLAFVFVGTSIVVFYTLIGRTVARQRRLRQERAKVTAGVKKVAAGDPSVTPRPHATRVQDIAPDFRTDTGIQPSCGGVTAPPAQYPPSSVSPSQKPSSSATETSARPSKTTLMMVVIAVVFFASYTPFLVLSFLKAYSGRLVAQLEGVARQIHFFFLRTYFINAVANPLVYSFFNVNFRRECIQLCRRRTRG